MSDETPYLSKDEWGEGPWQDEPDHALWRDEVTGLWCAIWRHAHHGQLNGYVGVPPGHAFYRLSYDDLYGLDISPDVHGGITYNGFRDDETWWFGFDTNHAWDIAPGMEAFMRSIRTDRSDWPWPAHLGEPEVPSHSYKDWDYVKRETESLALQLKLAEAQHPPTSVDSRVRSSRPSDAVGDGSGPPRPSDPYRLAIPAADARQDDDE